MHLADLHARAAEAGIEGYRLLSRDELIARLGGEVSGEAASEPPREPGAEAARPPRRGRRGGRRRRERERLSAPEAEPADEGDGEVEVVSGVLELTRQRHGFLRVEGQDDVYVSPSQVRRCELRAGDEVSGPARAPRRGERHRALVHVDSVNGAPPAEPDGASFDALTPAPPARRIPLGGGAELLVRAVDLLAPLAYGQRVLVRAAPRSGRTTLLRQLARALAAGGGGAEVCVLLIDERPEELPAWRELDGVELALAPADLAPAEQVRVAERAVQRARRAAAAGEDAILLCDSLSRLAVAAGGVAQVKRLFGSGRELAEEGAGSLTVVATALSGGDDAGSAERAVATTETSLVTLDPDLAERGIAPALRFGECRAVGQEGLLPEAELEGLRRLRGELRELAATEAAARVRELIEGSDSNAALLEALTGSA